VGWWAGVGLGMMAAAGVVACTGTLMTVEEGQFRTLQIHHQMAGLFSYCDATACVSSNDLQLFEPKCFLKVVPKNVIRPVPATIAPHRSWTPCPHHRRLQRCTAIARELYAKWPERHCPHFERAFFLFPRGPVPTPTTFANSDRVLA
jgi:hypothetical protein